MTLTLIGAFLFIAELAVRILAPSLVCLYFELSPPLRVKIRARPGLCNEEPMGEGYLIFGGVPAPRGAVLREVWTSVDMFRENSSF